LEPSPDPSTDEDPLFHSWPAVPLGHTPFTAPRDWFTNYTQNRNSALAKAALASRELAKRSLLEFVLHFEPGYLTGWVHREICDLLDAFIEAVERKLSPRLMIFLPPRAGKTTIVSRNFPCFALGRHPEWEIISATYAQDLANDYGRYVRNNLADPLYSELFPKTVIDPSSNAADRMDTTLRGGYKAVGVGGPLTGRGAHILLIDDPLKGRQEADSEVERSNLIKWYNAVARTRLAPGGGAIIVQTRWHESDLAGQLLEQAQANKDADQWKVYSYPAIATEDEKHRRKGEALHPERYPLSELHKIRASLTMGSDAREWSALYQQSPVPPEGVLFKRDWVKMYA